MGGGCFHPTSLVSIQPSTTPRPLGWGAGGLQRGLQKTHRRTYPFSLWMWTHLEIGFLQMAEDWEEVILDLGWALYLVTGVLSKDWDIQIVHKGTAVWRQRQRSEGDIYKPPMMPSMTNGQQKLAEKHGRDSSPEPLEGSSLVGTWRHSLLLDAMEFVLICTADLGTKMHPLNQQVLLEIPKGNPIFPPAFPPSPSLASVSIPL